MQWPFSREDCLRAIGRTLDERGITKVFPEEADTQIAVRCKADEADVLISYTTAELEQLVSSTRMQRGTGAKSSEGGYEQTLRAIGREIDRLGGKNLRISQNASGSFEVSYLASLSGRVRTTLLPVYLAELSKQASRRRRSMLPE